MLPPAWRPHIAEQLVILGLALLLFAVAWRWTAKGRSHGAHCFCEDCRDRARFLRLPPQRSDG